MRDLGEERVLLSGALHLHADVEVDSFCAVHRIDDGLIVVAHHFLSDADMIEFLGLIP